MPKGKVTHDISYTTNRELSWLKFNQRVLEQAYDENVPLYERLKFVSIFESNLDEFYMVRVGSLYDQSLIKNNRVDNKSGLTPSEQLKRIFKETIPLYKQKDEILSKLEKQLRLYNIERLKVKDLSGAGQKYVHQYFKTNILPVLSPQIVDYHHPFPHLANKSLNIILSMEREAEESIGLIPVPQLLPNILYLPGDVRFINMENIIFEYAHEVFELFEIKHKTIVSVTRNADISPEDELFDEDEDYRHHMKKILKKRKRLAPVRLEIQHGASEQLIDYLCDRLNIKKHQVFVSESPLCMSYVFELQNKFSIDTIRQITYPAFEPQPSPLVDRHESVLSQVTKRDIVLHYPYEQMEPFIRLLKEAAADPTVMSIKITIYRLANKSDIVKYLMEAVENNKDVTVLMELRARFDEANNINWAEELERAGCNVIYGFENYKVHSKICLITRLENNQVHYITQIGTGNYNEKTSKIYTDLCLMTGNEKIGKDAANFFKNMAISNLNGHYDYLLVAPINMKTTIIKLIDEEIAKAEAGETGKITMKMNSLTDRQIITKLSEASCAGVKIQLVIRGICCLVPGIPGKTENITVISIVGRFLEHSRIFCFGEGANMKMYIGSADIMTRNMEKRVEIACPIFDENVKEQINEMLEVQLNDNVKTRVMQNDGYYVKRSGAEYTAVDAQKFLMEAAIKQAAIPVNRPSEYTERSGLLRQAILRLRDRLQKTE
ncbi:polyphosphate kinase 1 [Peribacillus faecalis]|uniref:polyphosphate kinase 1 n=1 Tax=Peribacillus faecalis TaxID=2772559 RepID=UPI002E27D2DA|nr:polyphosphate kinase 1 [Peribacillus faecalis]